MHVHTYTLLPQVALETECKHCADTWATLMSSTRLESRCTISPSFPPTHTPTHTQVTTGHLDDPLISQAVDYASEGRMVRGCEEGLSIRDDSPPPPLGREDTDCVLWLAMQLVHIDSQTRRRSRLGPHLLMLLSCTSSTNHPPSPGTVCWVFAMIPILTEWLRLSPLQTC